MTRLLAVLALVALPVIANAECGWLLMTPPVLDKRTGRQIAERELPNRPLVEWFQQRAFDSAAQCEEAKGRITSASGAPAFFYSRCLPASVVPVK
jgi:hypothetical protein